MSEEYRSGIRAFEDDSGNMIILWQGTTNGTKQSMLIDIKEATDMYHELGALLGRHRRSEDVESIERPLSMPDAQNPSDPL